MKEFLLSVVENSDISFAVQIFVAEILVFCGFKLRKLGVLYFLIGIVATLTVALLWKASYTGNLSYITVSIIRYFVLFMLTLATMLASFDCNTMQAILYGITGYTMQHLASSIAFWIAVGGFGDYLKTNFLRLQYFTYIACIAVYTLLHFTLLKKIKARMLDLDKPDTLLLIVPSAIILFVSAISNMVFFKLRLRRPAIEIYHIVLCVISLFLQISLFRNSQITSEKKHIDYLLKMQGMYGDIAKESINAINIKYHDMKKQLETIRKIDSTEELSDYKKEIEDSITDYELIANTGNEVLNTVLTERTIFCKSKNIKFTYMANGKLLEFMTSHDLYSMLGNALDNAIEAVSALNDGKRVINLVISKEKNVLSIHIENFFNGVIEQSNGKLLTKKSDTTNHGFGLKSINLIAEKYGGAASVLIENDIFNLNIIFPIR